MILWFCLRSASMIVSYCVQCHLSQLVTQYAIQIWLLTGSTGTLFFARTMTVVLEIEGF